MNCLDFERRLDDDALATLDPAARAHAMTCARCAAALAFAERIEAALADAYGAPAPPPPAGLAAGVMARISAFEVPAARAEAARDAARGAWSTPDPALLGAVAAAALLVWRGELLWTMAQAWARSLRPAPPAVVTDLAAGLAPLGAAFESAGSAAPAWVWAVALGMVVLPAVVWGAGVLARTVERGLVGGTGGR
jgi:hypothetical protein